VLQCTSAQSILVGDLIVIGWCKQVFDSVAQWIRFAQNKGRGSQHVASKSLVSYKGRTLKDWEPELAQAARGDVGTRRGAAMGDDGADAAEELVDMERRKRELEAAARKAEKGLRLEPLGHDRLRRTYWSFPAAPDSVWVCAAAPAGSDRHRSEAVTGDGKRDVWRRFCAADGSLKALVEYLEEGPKGPLEGRLLPLIHKINSQPKAATGGGDEKSMDGGGSVGVDPAATGEGGAYEWAELPEIGDVVWARVQGEGKGGAATTTWQPMTLVDPPADDADGSNEDEDMDRDREGREAVLKEDDDEEWHTSGHEYIGQRVQVAIQDARCGGELTETGRVFGWLPAEEADFKSEETGQPAALWRVKFDDRNVTSQDLEEHEVRAAMRAFARAQAAKRVQGSAYLSQASLLGQRVRWAYAEPLDARRAASVLALGDLRPYREFRDKRVQELEAAGARKVLRLVQQADAYCQEREAAAQAPSDDLDNALAELGLGRLQGTELSAELQAAVECCMRSPRVIGVVHALETATAAGSVEALRAQLLAVYDAIKVRVRVRHTRYAATHTIRVRDTHDTHKIRCGILGSQCCPGDADCCGIPGPAAAGACTRRGGTCCCPAPPPLSRHAAVSRRCCGAQIRSALLHPLHEYHPLPPWLACTCMACTAYTPVSRIGYPAPAPRDYPARPAPAYPAPIPHPN
jgi:hypothetical protein